MNKIMKTKEGKDRAKDYLWKCRKCGWIES